MSQKNFLIKKISNSSVKTHRQKKTKTSHNFSLISLRNEQDNFCQQICQIQMQIEGIWSMVANMKIEISQAAILKYLNKIMQVKCYHNRLLILDLLKVRIFTKVQVIEENINIHQLIYELQNVKKQLQEYLWKKFCRDIDIMEDKIVKADQQIRDYLQLAQYERITNTFRPLLISNGSDLVVQYQNISGNTQKHEKQLQQMRFLRLFQSSGKISKLHNVICEQKACLKLFIN